MTDSRGQTLQPRTENSRCLSESQRQRDAVGRTAYQTGMLNTTGMLFIFTNTTECSPESPRFGVCTRTTPVSNVSPCTQFMKTSTRRRRAAAGVAAAFKATSGFDLLMWREKNANTPLLLQTDVEQTTLLDIKVGNILTAVPASLCDALSLIVSRQDSGLSEG